MPSNRYLLYLHPLLGTPGCAGLPEYARTQHTGCRSRRLGWRRWIRQFLVEVEVADRRRHGSVDARRRRPHPLGRAGTAVVGRVVLLELHVLELVNVLAGTRWSFAVRRRVQEERALLVELRRWFVETSRAADLQEVFFLLVECAQWTLKWTVCVILGSKYCDCRDKMVKLKLRSDTTYKKENGYIRVPGWANFLFFNQEFML